MEQKKRLVLRLGCGSLTITTPVSLLANEFDVRSVLHGQVSLAAVYQIQREGSGSVVECLTRDGGAAGLSLTGVTALWSLRKTHLS